MLRSIDARRAARARHLDLAMFVALASGCELVAGLEEKVLVAADGAGGTGAGGSGAGGSGAASGSTPSSSSPSSTSTGGGAPIAWHAPDCDEVTGADGVAFATLPAGDIVTTSPASAGDALGLVALRTPNVLVLDAAGSVYESRDAGCSWKLLANLHPSQAAELVRVRAEPTPTAPDPPDLAYGWVYADDIETSRLYRYDAAGVPDPEDGAPQGALLELDPPSELLIGFQTYPISILRAVDADGDFFVSNDGGATWSAEPDLPNPGCILAACERAAFSPVDARYRFVGKIANSVYYRPSAAMPGEIEVGLASGLEEVSVHGVTYSESSPGVVWVLGITSSALRALFFSLDGGKTFTQHEVAGVHENGLLQAARGAPDEVWFSAPADVFAASLTGFTTQDVQVSGLQIRALAEPPGGLGVVYFGLGPPPF